MQIYNYLHEKYSFNKRVLQTMLIYDYKTYLFDFAFIVLLLVVGQTWYFVDSYTFFYNIINIIKNNTIYNILKL